MVLHSQIFSSPKPPSWSTTVHVPNVHCQKITWIVVGQLGILDDVCDSVHAQVRRDLRPCPCLGHLGSFRIRGL